MLSDWSWINCFRVSGSALYLGWPASVWFVPLCWQGGPGRCREKARYRSEWSAHQRGALHLPQRAKHQWRWWGFAEITPSVCDANRFRGTLSIFQAMYRVCVRRVSVIITEKNFSALLHTEEKKKTTTSYWKCKGNDECKSLINKELWVYNSWKCRTLKYSSAYYLSKCFIQMYLDPLFYIISRWRDSFHKVHFFFF